MEAQGRGQSSRARARRRELQDRRRPLIAGTVALAALATFACEATRATPRPRAELPPGCWLEAGITAYGDPAVADNCGWGEPSGVCNDDCRLHTRKCVLESIAARRPFTATWTNHLVDGVGTRGAVVGRNGDAGYEVTWLDYEYVSGFDPDGAEGLKKVRASVKARFCTDLTDLMETCDPRLGAVGGPCSKGAARLRNDLFLECVTAEEKAVCSE